MIINFKLFEQKLYEMKYPYREDYKYDHEFNFALSKYWGEIEQDWEKEKEKKSKRKEVKRIISKEDPYGEEEWENEGIFHSNKNKENIEIGDKVIISGKHSTFKGCHGVVDRTYKNNALVKLINDEILPYSYSDIKLASKPKRIISKEDPYGEEIWESKESKELNFNFGDLYLYKKIVPDGIEKSHNNKIVEIVKGKINAPGNMVFIKFDNGDRRTPYWTLKQNLFSIDDEYIKKREEMRLKHKDIDPYDEEEWDEEEIPQRFRNYYKCVTCGVEWDDEWDCMCDDDCPACGTIMTPLYSDDI